MKLVSIGLLWIVTLSLIFPVIVSAQITHITGTYVGDGAATKSIEGLGFQPDVVFVKPDHASYDPWISTSSMTAGDARLLNTGTSLTSGVISTIDTDGFTVTSHNSANATGVTYHFAAFLEGDNLDVGSYTGNVTSVTTTGSAGDFQPEMVWIFGDSGNWWDYSGYTMRSHGEFWQWDGTTDNAAYPILGSYTTDGFNTGTGSRTASKTYHYVAFNADGTVGTQSQYFGNNDNPRDVDVSGEPTFLMLHRNTSDIGPIYFSSFGNALGGQSTASVLNTNYIKGTHSLGIITSNNAAANTTASSYHYFKLGGGNIALPIEVLSYEVSKFGDDVLVEWTTASELNNEKFEIEFSVNGTNFFKAGEVLGAGTTTYENSYYFIHDQVENGLLYYRIKQIDFDGTETYLDVKMVSFGYGSHVAMFPSLTSGEINLIGFGEAGWQMYNSLGELVLSGQQERLNISHFNAGTYYIRSEKEVFTIIKK